MDFEGSSTISSVSGAFVGSVMYNDIKASLSHNAKHRPGKNTIVGRANEHLLLLKSYSEFFHSKQPATALIRGESGIGKSSLVNMMRDPVINSQGYFCVGQFSEMSCHTQEPYSAIMAAFSDLCDLVVQSKDFSEQRRSEIERKLGDDVHILTNYISNLSPFLSMENVGVTSSSFEELTSACKTFLQALSSDDHPTVLFFDNIQWMDDESRKFVETLIRLNEQQELGGKMFLIFAYREDESSKDTVLQIFQQTTNLIDVPLKGLDLSDVHRIVSFHVDPNSKNIHELSRLVEKRTYGNPSQVHQFLHLIKEAGLIKKDDVTGECFFDVEIIQQGTCIMSEEMVDGISKKIEYLSLETQEVLKMASLVGLTTPESVLLEAFTSMRQSKESLPESYSTIAMPSLSDAIDNGHVEKTCKGIHFCHVKIQNAFRTLISGHEEEALLHLVLGEAFLTHGENDADIHQAAIHLNSTHMFLEADEKNFGRLLEINLQAAKYCIANSLFDAASQLLRKTFALMTPEQRWSDEYSVVSNEIMELLSKTELVVGNFDNAKAVTREVLKRGNSVQMKMNSHLRSVEIHLATHELSETIGNVKSALQMFGITIPETIARWHLLKKSMKVKQLLFTKKDDVLKLPMMKSEGMCTAVELLSSLSITCLISNTCLMKNQKNKIGTYAALLAMEMTLHHGLSPSCPTAFVAYGLVQLAMGHHRHAYWCGDVALKLMDDNNFRGAECATVSIAVAMLSIWRDPMAIRSGRLLQAVETGFKNGDVVHGIIGLSHYLWIQFMLGMNLHDLEEVVRTKINMITDLHQEALLLWLKPIHQVILNLQHEPYDWETLITLTGSAMDEEKYLSQVKEGNHPPVLVTILLMQKATLAVYFNFFHIACSIIEEIESSGHAMREINYRTISFSWVAAIAYFEQYRSTCEATDLKKAQRYRKHLQRMVALGCVDAVPYLTHLAPVELSLTKLRFMFSAITHLTKAYDDAISVLEASNAQSLGFLHEQAGCDLGRRGNLAEAKLYFAKALSVYDNKWGCKAKASWLREQIEIFSSCENQENRLVPQCVEFNTETNSCDDEQSESGLYNVDNPAA